ncbi:MAG TPA: hypothetical protein VG889_08680 [Rhizomicrobium sp.]|nr:hypothetical protein [Rhizomicrobium sp.]
MIRTWTAASLVCAALAAGAAAQTATPGGATTIPPTATGAARQPPPTTGSVDAPKTTTSQTTPDQQLPGEAKATTATDIEKKHPDVPTPAVPSARPHKHHPHTRAVPNSAPDEPGAPPPH